LVAVGGIVAACSSSTGSDASTPAPSAPVPSTPTTAASGTGAVLTPTADVPVGGGVILPDQAVVVTQPVSGTYKAFSAICTHEGCLVGSVENNEIVCPCHGARFSAEDGSVIQGPAQEPLAEGAVTVSGGNVVLTA
jgi:nitrite reductase/ring-hydroxylating ferredoxin subunit